MGPEESQGSVDLLTEQQDTDEIGTRTCWFWLFCSGPVVLLGTEIRTEHTNPYVGAGCMQERVAPLMKRDAFILRTLNIYVMVQILRKYHYW